MFVTASTFVNSSKRNGKKLYILVYLGKSKTNHTGSNTTSIMQMKCSKQPPLHLLAKLPEYFSMSLEFARLSLHTTAAKHFGCVCNVSKGSITTQNE